MKRFLCGVAWLVVFYLGSCFVVGFILEFRYGLKNSAGSPAMPPAVVQKEFTPLVPYLFFGSIGLAVSGTLLGVLPGTRKRSPDRPQQAPTGNEGNVVEPQWGFPGFAARQKALTRARYFPRADRPEVRR